MFPLSLKLWSVTNDGCLDIDVVHVFVFQHVVDAVLAIKKDKEPIDLHMVEIMEMMHKTDMDTT